MSLLSCEDAVAFYFKCIEVFENIVRRGTKCVAFDKRASYTVDGENCSLIGGFNKEVTVLL
jgi:hypothetical protein